MSMEPLIVGVVFLLVSGLTGVIAHSVALRQRTPVEERLNALVHGLNTPAAGPAPNLLATAIRRERDNALVAYVHKFFNLRQFLIQAGVNSTPSAMVVATLALTLAGAVLGVVAPFSVVAVPLLAAVGGAMPMLWAFFKRHRRLGLFEAQLPDAMELLARSLRAGHSLIEGMHLIGEEMPAPSGPEFGRCFEQQNLGVKLEDALEEMTERVPSVDLRFFATAIILQRQTGGDAAEILDKIGRLIRQRFQLRGQVAALTGEGRLSGVVLLALPCVLAVYMYVRDPKYLSVLVTDPIGQKMLAGGIVAQILGAIAIKKIVDIRV